MFATLPSPDGCALNDVQFGFQEKAKAAIETIQSFDDPQCLVIGVEGRWGSGKTVFLDCMKGALPKNTQSSPECMIHSPVFLGLLHGFRVCLGVLGLVWVLENWDTVEKCWKGICQFVSNTPFTTSFTNCMLVFTTLVFLCATAPFIFLIVRKLSGVVKMILQAMDALWQKGFLGEGENKNTTANLKEYNKSQAYHVTVSPWLYKGKDDLIETLFSDISACLDQALGQKENLKNIREGFKALATAYSKVGDTHDRVLSIAIHLFQFWTNEALELKKQRERLKTALKVGKVPIYVFIDDLDRLSQHEVLQVLDFLRHVGDLPYVRYIIAYDRNYVKEAIHKELYPAFVQDESKPQDFSEASRYLEKILWLEILLPQLTNQDYWTYFTKQCEDTFKDINLPKSELDSLKGHLLEDLKPLRKIKRLLANTLYTAKALNPRIPILALLVWENKRLKEGIHIHGITPSRLLALVPIQNLRFEHAVRYLNMYEEPQDVLLGVLADTNLSSEAQFSYSKQLIELTLSQSDLPTIITDFFNQNPSMKPDFLKNLNQGLNQLFNDSQQQEFQDKHIHRISYLTSLRDKS